jgi:hypothetical protein
VIDSAVPAVAIVGLKLEIVGAPEAPTVKADALVADPDGLVTPIVPVVAPDGTVTVSVFVVAAVTVALVPLKVTVLLAGVALNPIPWMMTVVPTGPRFGVNSMIVTAPEEWRAIDSRFPTAS